jgi:hypothetical protein
VVVRDVSAGGIGVLAARRFEPGTELSVELATGPGGRPRRLAATVVRVKVDRAGHWVHGCAFKTPLDTEQLRALLKMT